MGSLVLRTLSIFLGMYFVFVGLLKVTPDLHKDIHREIRRQFVSFAKLFPLSDHLGWKISPKYYRLTFGYTEIVMGTILAFVPGCLKQVSNIILLFQSLLMLHAHIANGDSFERFAPFIVFSLMLTCRLIVHWQISHQDVKAEGNKKKKEWVGRTHHSPHNMMV